MDVETGKIIGGIGAILCVLGLVPHAGTLLAIIGEILILIALKVLSEYYNEPAIFSDALMATILGIIGTAASTVGVFSLGLSLSMLFHSGVPMVISVIIVLIVAYIFIVLSALFYKRSLEKLGERSGEKLFRTAGLLMFIGAVLLVILIGGIIIAVAMILLAVAFFTLKTRREQAVV